MRKKRVKYIPLYYTWKCRNQSTLTTSYLDLVISRITAKLLLLLPFSHSVLPDSVTPWTAAHQASLSITNSGSLLKLMSIESVMPSICPILCHPLLLLPSILPSMRVFSNESAPCIRWPKYWSFIINPSNEYSRLISFRIDWFDFAVQGTLTSLSHIQSWMNISG